MSKRQSINIPGVLLDQLKERDYSNDVRFQNKSNNSRKRGPYKQLNRKERRKQQRVEKKQRRSRTGTVNSIKKDTDQRSDFASDKKRLKGNKPDNRHSKSKNDSKVERRSNKKGQDSDEVKLPFSSDDELSEGDFDEFGESDLNEEEWEQLRELEEETSEDGDNSGSDDDEPRTAEETMAKLKELQRLKGSKKKEHKGIESISKLKDKKKSHNKDDTEVVYPLTPAERAAIERDEMDMKYYAKKLNLKGKKKKIHARDEFDAIGGLLDGLDFFENYGQDDDEYGDFAIDNKNSADDDDDDEVSEISESESISDGEESEGESEELIENPFSSDDELSESDFEEFDEEDLDEEEWEQLRELEGKKSKKRDEKLKKENPYVAATYSSSGANETYIPPSLRKKQLEVANDESALILDINKRVKSSFNKLSDNNINVIISALNELYDNYPRNYVTEVITNQILDAVGQGIRLLDSFIINYAAVAYSLFRLRGLEIGASFIQKVVEIFLLHYSKKLEELQNLKADDVVNLSKECNNIITLLSYCYNFGFVSCRLIYDMIRTFVSTPNELTIELLLRIVAVSGQLIRGDDPSALKDILSELLNNVKTLKEKSPRLQFLLNTFSDLKNNRLKASMMAVDYQPLKKSISSIIKSTVLIEPLQVSLDDIKNVEERGKWWLVGASWRGNMNSAFDQHNNEDSNNKKGKSKNDEEIQETISLEDDLLDDIPDWDKIAREQRMNTDVRRAIFISIMSAQDYVDAFEKLEKLNLKNRQLLEVPKVMLHCLLADAGQNGYNPYYALVASKLTRHHHQLLKAFQFLFWDTVKKFEETFNSDSEDDMFDNEDDEDGNEEKRLANIANQGKFFGYLFSEGILKLDSFKHVPIMGGLTSDGTLFIEVLLYFVMLLIGKKSEKGKKKDHDGRKTFEYTDEHLLSFIGRGINIENKPTILKSLKWFISKKLKYKTLLVGKPNEKAYIRDKRRIEWAMARFIKLIEEEFENISI